jgi:hypothetical protein
MSIFAVLYYYQYDQTMTSYYMKRRSKTSTYSAEVWHHYSERLCTLKDCNTVPPTIGGFAKHAKN